MNSTGCDVTRAEKREGLNNLPTTSNLPDPDRDHTQQLQTGVAQVSERYCLSNRVENDDDDDGIRQYFQSKPAARTDLNLQWSQNPG